MSSIGVLVDLHRETNTIYPIQHNPSLRGMRALTDSPWPMFMGNPQHTGMSPYNTDHLDGSVKWYFQTEDFDPGSPIPAAVA